MDDALLLAGLIGIAPALALMYWTLKDYTYPKVEKPFFDDRRVFFILAVGMVVGVVVFAVQILFGLTDLLFVALFAILGELVKLVILNFPRFQRRLDTAFYGVTLGLGIGAMMSVGLIFNVLSENVALGPEDAVVIAFLAAQSALLNGATGGLIGIGVTKSLAFTYFSEAALYHLATSVILIGVFLPLDFPWWLVALSAATVLSGYAYWQMHAKILPDLVHKEVARFAKKIKKEPD